MCVCVCVRCMTLCNAADKTKRRASAFAPYESCCFTLLWPQPYTACLCLPLLASQVARPWPRAKRRKHTYIYTRSSKTRSWRKRRERETRRSLLAFFHGVSLPRQRSGAVCGESQGSPPRNGMPSAARKSAPALQEQRQCKENSRESVCVCVLRCG